MKLVDETLEDPGFQSTTHDRCIHKRTNLEGTILVLRQVDDFLIGTEDEWTANRLTKRIGAKVKFKHKKDPPVTFMGLVVTAMVWKSNSAMIQS